MAQFASNTTGNISTSGIWSVVEPTSFINSELSSYTTTTTFTACPSINLASTTIIDGVGLRIFRQILTTGTFTVALALAATPTVAIASVVVNVSDLAVFNGGILGGGGWAFFKFASSQTLTAGTNYVISVRSSIASTVAIYKFTTGTNNFSKYLRTTTTGTPATSGDDVIMCGDLTGPGTGNSYIVTNDNTTSNSYNTIEMGSRVTYTWGNTASTNYQLNLTGTTFYIGTFCMIVGPGSSFTSPTSFNATSTYTTNIAATGLGTHGISFRNGASLSLTGATKTPFATLVGDLAAGAITSLTTDVSTGWSTGDTITIAPTQRVIGQYETFGITGNASGTTVPLSVTLAFAHSGTSPFSAKIINQTRNIKFLGISQLLTFYINDYSDSSLFRYVEFAFMGSGNAAKRGIDLWSSIGTTIDNCSIHDLAAATAVGISTLSTTGHNNIVVSNCGFVPNNLNSTALNTSTTTLVNGMSVNNCVCISGGIGFNQSTDGRSSFTNLFSYGASTGITTASGPTVPTAPWAFNNCTAISNTTGFAMSNISGMGTLVTSMNNLTSHRNANYGFNRGNMSDITCNSWSAMGNGTAGKILTGYTDTVYFGSLNLQGGTVLLQPVGIYFNGASSKKYYLLNATIGTVNPHSIGDVSGQNTFNDIDMTFINSTLGSTNKIVNIGNFTLESRIGQQNIGGTLNNNITNKATGIMSYDTTIVDSSPVSLRLTPSNLNFKLRTNNYTVGVPASSIFTISVKVRKSSASDGVAYNGNQPRLVLQQNLAAGSSYGADIIAATASAAAGTWEVLTYTLPTSVSASTGLEFYVDCDGSAGWINVDTWNLS